MDIRLYSRPEHEGQFLKIAPFYKSLIIRISHTAGGGKNTFDLDRVRFGITTRSMNNIKSIETVLSELSDEPG